MTLPDIDNIDTLGGVLVNASPVMDPTTDLDAGSDNKARANNAMATHTAIRAMMSFVGNASTPTDPISGLVHDAVWGDTNAVKPTAAVSTTGVYNVTWPTTVQDALGVSHELRFRAGFAQVAGSTPYHVQTEAMSSPNKWRVRVFDMSGTPNAAAGATITLWVW